MRTLSCEYTKGTKSATAVSGRKRGEKNKNVGKKNKGKRSHQQCLAHVCYCHVVLILGHQFWTLPVHSSNSDLTLMRRGLGKAPPSNQSAHGMGLMLTSCLCSDFMLVAKGQSIPTPAHILLA